MSDLLNIISASDKRRNLLILLKSGPKEWDDIKDRLKVTSTGMLPQIKILEEEGLIERNNRQFSLTPMGRVLTAYMEPLIQTMDIFDKNKKFWQEHAIDSLPDELLLNIREIGDYRIIKTSDEEIFDLNVFFNNISKSKSIKGISHIVHPRYPEFFLDLARKGTKISLIFTPGVFKIMKEKYRKELREWLNFDTTELYVSGQDIRFSYIVTESYFSISFFYNSGIFDSINDVTSIDPTALAFGRRIFSYYQKRSEKIEHID
ncbi:MAG TPA: winged helix-turn-helix domain-containing protein [Nitrospirota bacterium]|nr:winged helix-turn-helix domain-containing protein [Nitrospirota bacterium]